jgi:hypothetical protein
VYFVFLSADVVAVRGALEKKGKKKGFERWVAIAHNDPGILAKCDLRSILPIWNYAL